MHISMTFLLLTLTLNQIFSSIKIKSFLYLHQVLTFYLYSSPSSASGLQRIIQRWVYNYRLLLTLLQRHYFLFIIFNSFLFFLFSTYNEGELLHRHNMSDIRMKRILLRIVHLYLFSYFCCLFVWIISLFDQNKAKLKARTDFKKTDLIFQVDSSYYGNRNICMIMGIQSFLL